MHEEIPAHVKHAFVCQILHWFMTERNLTEKNIEDKLDSWEKNAYRKLNTQKKRLEKELIKEAPLRESAKLFYDDDNNPYEVTI